MNKAAEIRAMFIELPKWSNRMIAEAVGTSTDYVRSVRQRLDPERRARDQRSRMARYYGGNVELAREEARRVYREARDSGKSVYEAKLVRRKIYFLSRTRTGCAAAAREAWKK